MRREGRDLKMGSRVDVGGEGVIMPTQISFYMIPMKYENELIRVHIGPLQKVVAVMHV